MSLTLDKDSAEYVRMLAAAQHEGDQKTALARLIKVGYSRINALTRHYSGNVDPKWPAPGRKMGKAPKAPKASRKRGPTEVSPETIAKRKAKVAKQIAKEKGGA